jgi:membrane protein DedA with SNARE-associated domain
MESLTHTLTALFYSVPETMRYVVIFLSSFIEGVPVIGSLFPGGTVALLIGSLSEGGFVNPLGAVAVIAIGTFAGDMIGFVAGRYFRHHRWLKTFIESEKHKKGWDIFDRHLAIVVIFGKLIPVVRSTPSIFAALRGVRFRRYVLYSGIGSVLWAFVGVYGGNTLAKTLGGSVALLIILGLLVVSGIIFLVQRIHRKRKK